MKSPWASSPLFKEHCWALWGFFLYTKSAMMHHSSSYLMETQPNEFAFSFCHTCHCMQTRKLALLNCFSSAAGFHRSLLKLSDYRTEAVCNCHTTFVILLRRILLLKCGSYLEKLLQKGDKLVKDSSAIAEVQFHNWKYTRSSFLTCCLNFHSMHFDLSDIIHSWCLQSRASHTSSWFLYWLLFQACLY